MAIIYKMKKLFNILMYECRKRPSADAERDLGVLYPAHNLPGGNLRLRNSERAHRGQDHGQKLDS